MNNTQVDDAQDIYVVMLIIKNIFKTYDDIRKISAGQGGG